MPILPRLGLALLALLLTALLAAGTAEAQQPRGNDSTQGSSDRPVRNFGVGGTSLTLSDIWGEPKMPKPPTDFGPHFDYPPETLNGPPLHDPYPN